MKTSQAQQTTVDLINQTIAQMSAGGEKTQEIFERNLAKFEFSFVEKK